MITNKQTGASRFHVDVPKAVRSHLLGENHSNRHKFIFGSFIMLFGVTMVKSSLFVDSFIFHILADAVGYSFHAIGAIPIIKSIDREGKI
jgi:hypothetical protein